MSYRCRTEPDFARAIFECITSDKGRALFLKAYGLGVLVRNVETAANDV